MPDTAADFPDHTRQSLILRASIDPTGPAMEDLCELYWEPVYAFYRSCKIASDDAQDLTQDFLAQLSQGAWLAAYDPMKGRFKSWLTMKARSTFTDWYQHERAKKRSGGKEHVSWDFPGAEERFSFGSGAEITPEHAFDRSLIQCLLVRAYQRLAADLRTRGHEVLLPFIERDEPEHGEITAVASTLGISPAAVSSSLYRYRKAYRDLLRDEVKRLLGAESGDVSEDAVDEELQNLSALLNH